jgi:RNA polymerase sigma-70 factor (ECF subfamily)
MSPSSTTNQSLIARIRQEDGAAWTELVSLYGPLFHFWLRRQGVIVQDIPDLTQEIFFAVSRSIERYQPTGTSGSFRAWLWSLARHKMIDAFRRNRNAPVARGGSTALINSENLPERLDEGDESELIEYRSLVHRALKQVRSEFEARSWQAFWRTTVDGIGVEQVAEELGMSKATVRQHRSRVLRRLRQQLGEIE